jgi:hypothetical protein
MPAVVGVALIIFGGGWGAEGTQASIETHVLALREGLGSRTVRVLFASGDPTIRDVQVESEEASEASALLGLVFDRQDHLNVAYRPAKTPAATVASKRALLDALRETAENSKGTIVFGVGHGSPSSKEERASIELFGPDDSLAVDELARALDGTTRRAPIAFVLGQCHSGAFTELSFVSADPKAKAADPARCVLAAVPADRQAAGCSPDADDPDARAYMALIAEAFAKNPNATLTEAHAYARINDHTIDVPVASSETWLAQTLGKKAPARATIALEKLLPKARATERSVIAELQPAPNATPRSVGAELAAIDQTIQKIDDALDELQNAHDRARRQLLDALLLRYPELANPYHSESRRLMAGEADELVAFLKSRRELLEIDARSGEMQSKERERFELEKKAARLERWLNAAQVIANEEALRRSKNRAAIRVLDRLIACESLAP